MKDSVGSTSYVMWVKRHKTMKEGPAQIVISEENRELLRKYVVRIRNHIAEHFHCLYADSEGTRATAVS